VLADARAVQRRLRLLRSREGAYFVLASGLFPRAGYPGVRAELTAAVYGLALGHDHDDRGSALADEAAPEGAGYLVPGLDGSADHDQVGANLLGDA
jgi:hypothetical protein